MAKSLRSKRKRKIRAEKRIVNAKKELVKLKQVAAKLHTTTTTTTTTDHSSTGGRINKRLTKEAIEALVPGVSVTECPMQIEGEPSGSGPSKRQSVMKINNQWMNQRKIKSIKGRIKRHNQKKARRGHSAGLSSRKTKKALKGK